MDLVTILAKTVQSAHTAAQTSQTHEHAETILPLDTIWEHITSLQGIEALILISFGAICLFYGWRIFKILVIISFSMLGLAIGWFFTKRFIVGFEPLWGGIICMLVLGISSISLVKWAVCTLGAIAGGAVTAGIWYAAGLSDQYIWAGALIGMVAGGMISFIVFKISIMLFTSIGGSILIVAGILTLLYLHHATQQRLEDYFFTERWFLPVIVIIPTFAGLYIQSKFIKGSSEWSV